jgi:ubiquitin-activating enzyme E1
MRLYEIPSSLLCLITIISQSTRPVIAGPLLPPEQFPSLANNSLVERGSCSYGQTACGYYGQLCCNSNEYCYTDGNDEAQCGLTTTEYQTVAQSTSGQWSMYTTTYVQTDLKTVTTTYSSFYPVTTQQCTYAMGETPCGSCCCQSGQMCQSPNQCVVVAGGSSAYYSTFYTTTNTQTAIVPLRGTSGTTITLTSSGSITTTVPYETAVGTGGAILTGTTTTTSHALSGGAIAGIVIGVIAGLILLFLLCACLCFKTLWDGLLSIFGIRRSGRRRTEETYIDRRSSRRQSGGRTWFGAGPRRASRTSVDVVEKRRTSGGWGGIATVGAALGGLALLLGLKRSRDRRREEDKSSVSYNSYYSSNYTSASELS